MFVPLRRPRRAAAVALAALAALIITVPTTSAEEKTPTSGTTGVDGPVSGELVPALRGKAASDAAGSYVTDRYRELATTRGERQTRTIQPWAGALHNGWGVFPTVVSDGAQATHSVNPHIQISPTNPDIIYAPTLTPSGKTCIEVTTFYWQGGNGVGAWDWCAPNPGFAAVAWIDADFLATYTVPFHGLRAYTVRDVQTDPVTNEWTAYLYNHTTGAWDELFTSADTSKLVDPHGGWSMFEVYTYYNSGTGEGYYCTETYGSMWWTTDYQLLVNGSWQSVTAANSNASTGMSSTDLGCYSLSFSINTPNSNWQVTH